MNADSLRAFVLALFILALMICIQPAHAAITAVPSVAGYSAGSFSAAAGSFSTAANAASYGATGVVNVGGKAITVPATLRMAANAGQYAKNAMKLNPWAIVGTLAAGYLIDQLLEWDDASQTWRSVPAIYPGGTVSQSNACSLMDPGQYSRDAALNRIVWMPHPPYPTSAPCPAPYSPFASCSSATQPYYQPGNMPYTVCIDPASSNQPYPYEEFPDSAWDPLPDPLPVVAPELPYAPYMPNGAPVESPEYDFAPFSTPIGNPYTKPDGSTVQPMAKVSPNGDSVTIDTYDQPLTDSTGAPVPPDTVPVDTVEPLPPAQTDCDKYPNSIGCSEYGVPSTPDVIPTNQIAVSTGFTPVGGAGSCPADVQLSFMGQIIPWSYSPICDFATMIRPLIIGFAWLSFGFTVISGFRKAG